jgi:hypothetical protein
MASAAAIAAPTASPISSLKYGSYHFSGDSVTPSSDTNNPAVTFLIETSFVRRAAIVWSEHTSIVLKHNHHFLIRN